MKRFLALGLALCLLACLIGCQSQSMTDTPTQVIDATESTETNSTEFETNPNDKSKDYRLITSIYYDKNDEETLLYNYTYDIYGNQLIHSFCVYLSQSVVLQCKEYNIPYVSPAFTYFTYKYNANNQLSKRYHSGISVDGELIEGTDEYHMYENGGFALSEYDNNGMPVETQFYDSNGRLTKSIVYTDSYRHHIESTYNTDGNLVKNEWLTYSKSGDLQNYSSTTYTYEYDRYGRPIQQKDSSGKNKAYSYDENSNLIEIKSYDENGHYSGKQVNKYAHKDSVMHDQSNSSEIPSESIQPSQTEPVTTQPDYTQQETSYPTYTPATTHAHSYGEWQSNSAANHVRYCSCGDKQTETHTYGAGVITKEATESSEGIKKFTCKKCNYFKEEIIPIIVPILSKEELEQQKMDQAGVLPENRYDTYTPDVIVTGYMKDNMTFVLDEKIALKGYWEDDRWDILEELQVALHYNLQEGKRYKLSGTLRYYSLGDVQIIEELE